ncbi:hypothetical protein NEF87_001540 [Candidatus Lokiarchaeum ossiferum]|uniref:SHSP domain-containing protein n=1 Tax=Candidatus Lokiarchaeum ossiferum TaxID=2951803 RepID=A0ABY6HP02_9ARCH|nr:hypothetical protein NEF87_001540 [Candidatus Lokiarchaeum sp. B-35]
MHYTHGCHGPNPQMFQFYMNKYAGYMPYDLEEDEGTYYVTMPLPGFDVKDIEVSVKGDAILIEAKKPQENTEKDPPKRKKIINIGDAIWKRPISVKIPVHDEIDPAKVKAKLKRGILEVNFSKKPGMKVPIAEEE